LSWSVRIDPLAFIQAGKVINEAIEAKHIPGAVLLVAVRDQVYHLEAYGQKSVKPVVANMTTDTIFDLASLTKPFATAISVMQLIEQGQLRLWDTLPNFFSDITDPEKMGINVESLLLHVSGLVQDNPEEDYSQGIDVAIKHILDEPLNCNPWTVFNYSDLGYILLAEIVHKVSGKPINEYAHDNIYEVMGLKDTGYLPPKEKLGRIAPTTYRDDHWLQGEVNDPRAALLGGVAGHAGLFSTAADLLEIVNRLLYAEYNKVLSKMAVKKMLTPVTLPGGGGLRGLGWDMQTVYSSNQGDLFLRGFGHTGYTGTSVWVDLDNEVTIILLTNAVHPSGAAGGAIALRSLVASVIAAGVEQS